MTYQLLLEFDAGIRKASVKNVDRYDWDADPHLLLFCRGGAVVVAINKDCLVGVWTA